MKRGRANGFCCLICERWYAEMEDADVCEQSHEENPRDKYDDDGRLYADPRDYRDGLE